MPLLLGIDLGGTNTRLGLVGPSGLLADEDFATLAAKGPEDWLERLAPAADRLRVKAQGLGGGLAGIGLGTPGILDRVRRKVLASPNLKTWVNFPLGEALDKVLGLPVAVENDANCYALGEYHFGLGQGKKDLACFTLGTGVGGGLIYKGELVLGSLGCGGELGHIVVEPEGRLCGCGARGCLEAYASATGLRASLEEALAKGVKSRLASGAGVKDMEAAALAGDTLALELFSTAGKALGRAVGCLAAVTGLDLVVVGGGVARGWFLMEGACREELEKRFCMCPASGIQILRSRLEDTAPILGAASLAGRLFSSRQL